MSVDASVYCKICDKTIVGQLFNFGDHYFGDEHRRKVEDLSSNARKRPKTSPAVDPGSSKSASKENRGKFELEETDFHTEVKLVLDAAGANSPADIGLLQRATTQRLNAGSCRFCSVDFPDPRARRIHELSNHTLLAAALKTFENTHVNYKQYAL